ncbi:VOC family protein [Nocardia jinanensis]|uniref:Glyoxalase n=1 Tax=Nocardia jinanensis TaxID=382504 RepID=A0A917VSV4_9NOCA|nr:VOC family protein [Nocardia jinanensis]GGL10768.1 glyoxalase [Nocardia jinanensis]
MNVSLTSLIIEAADPERESAFWHRLLGGSITKTPTHHFLRVDEFPTIVIQHAPGHQPPQWPEGISQQMHFDLATDDPRAADERVLDAGGRRLRPTDDIVASAQQGSRVYASPAGHPFCLRSA